MDKRETIAARLGNSCNMVWELGHLTFKDRLKASSLLVVEKRWMAKGGSNCSLELLKGEL